MSNANDMPVTVGPSYKISILRREDYSGEHREWLEEYFVPPAVVAQIQADALAALVSSQVGDGVDWEADAWHWLDNRGTGLDPAGDPNDRGYGTDDMVDAFIAGTEAALARPRSTQGQPA